MGLKILDTAVNRVTMQVDCKDARVVRIYRAEQADGALEEVGVAREDRFVDTANLIPGKTYYYIAVGCQAPHLYPEQDELQDMERVKAQVPRAPHEKRVALTQQTEAFAVQMRGYVDESNAVTLGPEVYCPGPNASMPPYDQVFEPNLYVVIENTGETDVVNPWLVANGQRDWWSVETMAKEAIGGRDLDEEERMMAVWQFVVDEVYDSRCGISWFDDVSDPVKLFNAYGFEGCIGYALATSRLAEAMGVPSRQVWVGGILDGHGRGRQCSHAISEAWANGAWHLLDTDQMVFFLNRDNRTVANVADLARDPDLMNRSHRNLGLPGKDMAQKDYYSAQFKTGDFVYPPNPSAAWTGRDGRVQQDATRLPKPHTMAMRLRPGEKLVRYWGRVGKTVVRGRRLHPQVRYSNGKLVYRPDLRTQVALQGLEDRVNVIRETSRRLPAVHPAQTQRVSRMIWKVQAPYPIAGAKVGLSYRRATREDGLEVLLSRDGKDWRSIWVASRHRTSACVDLDWYLNPALFDWREERDTAWQVGPRYEYYIQVAMWAGSRPDGVGLDTIWFDTDLQCATRSLPSLFCGENHIQYRDETMGKRQVRITYGWQEEHRIKAPDSPDPVFPAEGAEVDGLDFEFCWKQSAARGARVDDYHVQVSRYADFRWCVCPTFDRYVSRTAYRGKTCWRPQFAGLLNPGEAYYWRVRARNAHGVWSDWSRACAFAAGQTTDKRENHDRDFACA